MKSGDVLLPRAGSLKAQVERDLMALVVEGVQDDQSGAGIGCQAGKCFDQVGLGGNFLAADFLQYRVGQDCAWLREASHRERRFRRTAWVKRGDENTRRGGREADPLTIARQQVTNSEADLDSARHWGN